jgi:hypothetical protein
MGANQQATPKPALTSFQLPMCAPLKHDIGGCSTLYPGCGREMAAMDCEARILEEDHSVLSLDSPQEGQPLHRLQQQP